MTAAPAHPTPTTAPRRRRFAWAWAFAALALLPGAGVAVASAFELPLVLAGGATWPNALTSGMAFLGMLIAWPLGLLGLAGAVLGVVGRRWALAIASLVGTAGCVATYQLAQWFFF